MTDSAKLILLKTMIDPGDSDETLTAFLDIAAETVLNAAYPYQDISGLEVPARYDALQVEIAAYLLNKRGAEGEVIHSENGVQRSYGSAGVPTDYLKGITPFCGVVGEE